MIVIPPAASRLFLSVCAACLGLAGHAAGQEAGQAKAPGMPPVAAPSGLVTARFESKEIKAEPRAAVVELTRAIAPDRSQPLLLRKAALNLIGRHGTEQDLTILRLCSRESPRLAQAGEPAARVLKDRLAGIPQPVLHPY